MNTLPSAEAVLDFWLAELTPKDWYAGGDELDAKIRDRFEPLWHDAMAGGLGTWLTDARGALAYLILTDQFSRNMFRNTQQAFASDPNARAAAKLAVEKGWDMQIKEPERQFFYMPFEHSENLVDQDKSVYYMLTRMPETGGPLIPHAVAHRNIIRRFGRFPSRNSARGDANSAAEAAWLGAGGYPAEVKAVEAAAEDGSAVS